MYERRKTERRRWEHVASYPLIDSDGKLVTHNRRRVVDRRLLEGGDVPSATAGARELRLRFKGRDVVMHGDSLTLGRQSDRDVVVAGPMASRCHARIERRGTEFVLVDSSRNGTFVRFHGENGVRRVKAGELRLQGPGVMSLGHDFKDRKQADAVHFDIG